MMSSGFSPTPRRASSIRSGQGPTRAKPWPVWPNSIAKGKARRRRSLIPKSRKSISSRVVEWSTASAASASYWAGLAPAPPLRVCPCSFLLRTNADPIEIGFPFQILQAVEHLAHIVGAAMAGQSQEFLTQLALIERLARRAFKVGDGAREHAAVFERDRDDCGQRGRAVLGDRDRHAFGKRADLRVPQRAFVEGARIARIADMGERDTERDAVLRHHDVGGCGNVIDPRHLIVAGDVDGGDIRRRIAVLGT